MGMLYKTIHTLYPSTHFASLVWSYLLSHPPKEHFHCPPVWWQQVHEQFLRPTSMLLSLGRCQTHPKLAWRWEARLSELERSGRLTPMCEDSCCTFSTSSPLAMMFSNELESRGQLPSDLRRIQGQSIEKELKLVWHPSACAVKSLKRKGRGWRSGDGIWMEVSPSFLEEKRSEK